MSNSDASFPWANLIDIGAIIGIALALLYTAGWSYSYHYFQCFHLGLVGLELEREYFLLYGFWVCKARLCSVLLCLLTAFGLPLLFQRIWEQAVALGGAVGRKRLLRLRIAASLGGPVGLLLHHLVSAWRMDRAGRLCAGAARRFPVVSEGEGLAEGQAGGAGGRTG